jgi:hypothetical protein
MPFTKDNPIPGPGRPKGSKDKFTDLKQAFLDAFEQTGGTEGLAEWAKNKDNKAQFYQMVTKLLPKQIDQRTENTGTLIIKWKGE